MKGNARSLDNGSNDRAGHHSDMLRLPQGSDICGHAQGKAKKLMSSITWCSGIQDGHMALELQAWPPCLWWVKACFEHSTIDGGVHFGF